MMKASELKPGDIFTVDPPDPESTTRVCLSNDERSGLRFGWPGNDRFWCCMGEGVPVTLMPRPKEPTPEDEARCPHGQFYTGAGACAACSADGEPTLPEPTPR